MEELAKQVSNSDSKKNKSSQLRKFYDELFKLNQLAKADKESWDIILPQVHMIIAKAAYAKGRGLITDDFLIPLKQLIEAVERPDLNTVVSFLEAFTGFHSSIEKINAGR